MKKIIIVLFIFFNLLKAEVLDKIPLGYKCTLKSTQYRTDIIGFGSIACSGNGYYAWNSNEKTLNVVETSGIWGWDGTGCGIKEATTFIHKCKESYFNSSNPRPCNPSISKMNTPKGTGFYKIDSNCKVKKLKNVFDISEKDGSLICKDGFFEFNLECVSPDSPPICEDGGFAFFSDNKYICDRSCESVGMTTGDNGKCIKNEFNLFSCINSKN